MRGKNPVLVVCFFC
uniref:Uncharacterized protein n=1 Tax=Rhizophora mucronata TaxID=61149 RepID=A0A2P2NI05_RHIMU